MTSRSAFIHDPSVAPNLYSHHSSEVAAGAATTTDAAGPSPGVRFFTQTIVAILIFIIIIAWIEVIRVGLLLMIDRLDTTRNLFISAVIFAILMLFVAAVIAIAYMKGHLPI
jgi:hypothetical protein